MNDEILKFLEEHEDGMNRNKSYLKNKFPKCKFCNNYLILDDIDADFIGKQNETWVCSECEAFMEVIVKYNKVYGIKWFKGDRNG